jgi:glutaredoxin
MIILNVSEPTYGILSCNSKSNFLKGKTMSKYVIDGVVKDLGTKTVDYYMKQALYDIEIDSEKGVAIPTEWYRIDGNLSDRVIGEKINNVMLQLYTQVYPEIKKSVDKLNSVEIRQINDTLFSHYAYGKFDGTRVRELIDKFRLSIVREDGMTIGEYVVVETKKVKDYVSEMIIRKMNAAIQIRLNEPLFVKALAKNDTDKNNELPFTVKDEDGDVDTLEQLNIFLLERFRVMMRARDVTYIMGSDKKRTMTVVVNILNALMTFIEDTKMFINTEKTIVMNDPVVSTILSIAFGVCDDMIVIGTEIPEYVRAMVKSRTGFENIDPNILWSYLQQYVVSTYLSYSETNPRDSVGKFSETADKFLSMFYPKTQKEILADRMRRKFNLSRGFSPAVHSVVIYTMEGCGHCTSAKNYFDKNSIKYEVRDESVWDSKDGRDSLQKYNSGDSIAFPIVIIGDKWDWKEQDRHDEWYQYYKTL